MPIKGCAHGPAYLIPQPCAECEHERVAEAERLERIRTVLDDKGGSITKEGPSSYRMVLTESHVCGLSGFSVTHGDRCPACDQWEILRDKMRQVGSGTDSAQRSELLNGQERSAKENHQSVTKEGDER